MVLLGVFVALMYIKFSIAVEFTEKVADKTATEGHRLVWNCAVKHIESNQKLEWNGYDSNNPGIKHRYDDSTLQATLVFESVSRDDEGIYWCTVKEDDVIITQSDEAKLSVRRIPLASYPSCKSNTNYYVEGEEAELSCCSEVTEPEVAFTWTSTVDSQTTGETKYRNNLICSIYKFSVNVYQDKRGFTCTIMSLNMIKPRNCTVGPLDVKYKPRVKLPPKNITVGRKAIILCQAEANPADITYRWDTSTKFQYNKIRDYVMEIDNPDKSINGTTITCIAENDIGSSSASFIVRLFPSDFDTGAVGPVVDPGETASPVSFLSTVLLIAGSCTMIALLIMILPLCYCFFSPRHNIDYFGRFVPQPEVYFQPKEIETTEHETPARRVWKRSCAVQVPEDISSFYAELPCGRGAGDDDEFVDNV